MKDGRNAPPEIISAHCDAWRYSSLLSFVQVLETSEIRTKDRWSWKWDLTYNTPLIHTSYTYSKLNMDEICGLKFHLLHIVWVYYIPSYYITKNY